MKNGELKPDYGNWVPKRLLILLATISLLLALALAASIHYRWGELWTIVLVLLFCIGLLSFIIMYILYRAFSQDGDALVSKIHEYVTRKLPWNGEGRLLDVGCGAGALTIRCARKFPKSQCTGIDYWGVKWDYSQKMCQHNAEAEGVTDRCTFEHGDAKHLDFADETFDAVVSNFVYHEVRDSKSKEELLRETLRVLKKGGAFALQDLFGQSSIYGDFQTIMDNLEEDAVSEIHYADSCKEIPIPHWMQMPGMLSGVGIIYGKKIKLENSITKKI
jgi:SAM-dependent methyltransferase